MIATLALLLKEVASKHVALNVLGNRHATVVRVLQAYKPYKEYRELESECSRALSG